jgi:hypothetical protein
MRADIKAAVTAGYLPDDLAYRVRTGRGSPIDIEARGMADEDATRPPVPPVGPGRGPLPPG